MGQQGDGNGEHPVFGQAEFARAARSGLVQRGEQGEDVGDVPPVGARRPVVVHGVAEVFADAVVGGERCGWARMMPVGGQIGSAGGDRDAVEVDDGARVGCVPAGDDVEQQGCAALGSPSRACRAPSVMVRDRPVTAWAPVVR